MLKAALKSKKEKLFSAISPYRDYSFGYMGQGGYLLGLVAAIGRSWQRFGHKGSDVLDTIVAFDDAEVRGAYFGQINMVTVSSFSGPDGLIWGYDIVPSNTAPRDFFVTLQKRFPEIVLRDGMEIRSATEALFGTARKKNFPLYPGCIVPSAGRSFFKKGPAELYAAVGIGVPDAREKDACLIMEDVGVLPQGIDTRMGGAVSNILANIVCSINHIGKAHGISYEEIILDFTAEKVSEGETGCAFVAAPYFQLARGAYDKNLTKFTLNQWIAHVNKRGRCIL